MPRPLEPLEVKKLIDLAITETEQAIFYEIKRNKTTRYICLAELDVLNRVTERLHARLEYTDPLG